MHAHRLHHRSRRWRQLSVIILLSVGSALNVAAVPSAYATSIDVTTTDDEINTDGDCSLREAVQAANEDHAVDACTAGNGTDTISIPAGSYAGPIVITSDVTITGAGIEVTLINGREQVRGLEVLSGTATIADLTIQNAISWQHGGGIYNAGVLALNTVSLHNNVAITFNGVHGGAIFNSGTLTISGSVVRENGATDGGGIYNTGLLTIDETTLESNGASRGPGLFGSGGAIFNSGTATITRSTFRDNLSVLRGGGIDNWGTLFISSSSFIANEAWMRGGALMNAGNRETSPLPIAPSAGIRSCTARTIRLNPSPRAVRSGTMRPCTLILRRSSTIPRKRLGRRL